MHCHKPCLPPIQEGAEALPGSLALPVLPRSLPGLSPRLLPLPLSGSLQPFCHPDTRGLFLLGACTLVVPRASSFQPPAGVLPRLAWPGPSTGSDIPTSASDHPARLLPVCSVVVSAIFPTECTLNRGEAFSNGSSLFYSQYQEQHVAHSRLSINIW